MGFSYRALLSWLPRARAGVRGVRRRHGSARLRRRACPGPWGSCSMISALEDPDLHARRCRRSSSRSRRRSRCRRAACAAENAALVIPLDARDLGAAEAAAALDTDCRARPGAGRLHGSLHHAAEGNAALELLGDVLGHQLGVDLGLRISTMLRCTSSEVYFWTSLFQLLDVGALLADHHARTRRVDGDAALLVRTLDDDLRHAGSLELLAQVLADS